MFPSLFDQPVTNVYARQLKQFLVLKDCIFQNKTDVFPFFLTVTYLYKWNNSKILYYQSSTCLGTIGVIWRCHETHYCLCTLTLLLFQAEYRHRLKENKFTCTSLTYQHTLTNANHFPTYKHSTIHLLLSELHENGGLKYSNQGDCQKYEGSLLFCVSSSHLISLSHSMFIITIVKSILIDCLSLLSIAVMKTMAKKNTLGGRLVYLSLQS